MKRLQIGDYYKYMGYELKITKREGQIAFAENDSYGIEVFRIKNRKESTFPNGSVSEGGECPPGTSEWGNSSGYWRTSGRTNAEKYFTELVSRQGDE